MNDISLLNPRLRILCQEFLTLCDAQGLYARITQTYRSKSQQDALYAKGRTTPGPIVTNAPGGRSKHECVDADGLPASKAFDFILKDELGKIITDGSDKRYYHAGQIGKSLGLEWGGDWKHPDYDHFQIT